MARSNPPASVKGCSQKPPVVPPAPKLVGAPAGLARARSLPTVCQRSLVAPNLVGAGDDESPVRRHHIAERYL